MLRDDLRGAKLAVGQFRILMEIAAPLDDARLHFGDRGINPRGQIVCTLSRQAGAEQQRQQP